MTQGAQDSRTTDLAIVADWLAAQVLTCPDTEKVRALRTVSGQVALAEMGQVLACPEVTERLTTLLSSADEADVVEALTRSYAAHFEGVFRKGDLPPYASIWDGTGRYFGPASGRMQKYLRQLDVHFDHDGNTPMDHLGIELAALAEALRQGSDALMVQLVGELTWAKRYAATLSRTDEGGFYGIFAQMLTAYLETMTQHVGQVQPTLTAAG